MTQTISYEYANGDLLESPNNYFYTKFHGKAFLNIWLNQRENVLATPSYQAIANQSISEPCSTDTLLDSLFNALSMKSMLMDNLQILNRLVQRFEVSKRLHAQYNENFRPVNSNDFYHLDRYVRFAEVLDLAYVVTNSLPYLNAFLKCMDTLTALKSQLNEVQTARLNQLIKNEKAHIQQLALKIGVTDYVAE